MTDTQLNVPKCSLCGLAWSRYSPLVYIGTRQYCGNCMPKVIREMREIQLDEAERRINEKIRNNIK